MNNKFNQLFSIIMEDINSNRKPIQKVNAMSPVDFIAFLKEFLPYVKEGKVDLNDVRITEKVDGCLDENTLIETLEYGNLKISEVIEKCKNEKIHIKSFDLTSNEIIFTEVLNTSIKENLNNWNLIELENGSSIILTDEHPVYLPDLKCFRKVSELKNGDLILFDNEN